MNLDTKQLRSVLGHFCSGIVVVTSGVGERPLGLTAQSFTSLSLDPPLILFCPAKSSKTWPEVRATGKFCVNVLSEEQRATSQQFAHSGGDKFAGVGWEWSPGGLPVLFGCIAYVECTLDQVHDAGDHQIAVGRVDDLRLGNPNHPLVFYQGSYRQLLRLEDEP